MAWADELETVYRTGWERLVRHLRHRYYLGRDDAEDVAQETFIKMLQYPHYFRARGVTLAAMFWFAHDVAFNHLRRAGRLVHAFGPAEEMPDLLESQPIAPVGDCRLRLADVCEHLSPAQWNALVLLGEGASYQQVADDLGISLGGARSLISRARHKARAVAA